MEYQFLLIDDKLNFVIVEGHTNSTGINALLKRFTDLSDKGRQKFTEDLNNGAAEFLSKPSDEKLYSIAATRIGPVNGGTP